MHQAPITHHAHTHTPPFPLSHRTATWWKDTAPVHVTQDNTTTSTIITQNHKANTYTRLTLHGNSSQDRGTVPYHDKQRAAATSCTWQTLQQTKSARWALPTPKKTWEVGEMGVRDGGWGSWQQLRQWPVRWWHKVTYLSIILSPSWSHLVSKREPDAHQEKFADMSTLLFTVITPWWRTTADEADKCFHRLKKAATAGFLDTQ